MSEKPTMNREMTGLVDRAQDLKRVAGEVEEVGRNSTSLADARRRLDHLAWMLQQRAIEVQRTLDTLIAQATAAMVESKQKTPKERVN